MIKNGKFVANVVVKISDKSKLSYDATGDRVYDNREKLGAYVAQKLYEGYTVLGGISDNTGKGRTATGNVAITFSCGGPKASMSIDFNSFDEIATQIDLAFAKDQPKPQQISITAPAKVEYVSQEKAIEKFDAPKESRKHKSK